MRLTVWTRRIFLALLLVSVLILGASHFYIRYVIVEMPGSSYTGLPLSNESDSIRALSSRLEGDVRYLAEEIGGRSIYNVGKLDQAKDWITERFGELGLQPMVQSYLIEADAVIQAISERNRVLKNYGRTDLLPEYTGFAAQEVANVWIEIKGCERPEELLVVGAHYDTVNPDCPGADDNSSGVAGLLEIARHLNTHPPRQSVFLVAFTCEEYPVGGIDKMGSSVFLSGLLNRRKTRPVGMISLEMLGYYADEPGSQKYPAPFSFYFPDTANFIGFVGDASSRKFIHSMVRQFRQIPATIPSEGVAAPFWLAPDVLRSDHEPFVKRGIPGLMVTDTSNFRYGDHLHQATDTPEKLDYIRMAYVVKGLSQLIETFEL